MNPLQIGLMDPSQGGQPLSDDDRAAYGGLADVLIPAAEGMPAASEVDVHTRWVDQALRLRPDLRPFLTAAIVAAAAGGPPREVVIRLAEQQPEVFAALGQLTSGAYYMDDRVRQAMGYPGQEARRLVDDTEEYLEMLGRVVERGPVYRPAPQ
jgi:hypothetical protein